MALMHDPLRLGAAVRARRIEKDLYQRDLAKRAGISVGTVRNIEQGKGASDLVIAALEKALEWVSGSGARVLAGEDPEVIPAMPATYVSSRTRAPVDLSGVPLEELQAELNRRIEALVKQAVADNPDAPRL